MLAASSLSRWIGSSTSRMILSTGSEPRLSSVAETPPSTEFSMGTSAASTSPERTALRVATTEA